jgi:hypothetical protein
LVLYDFKGRNASHVVGYIGDDQILHTTNPTDKMHINKASTYAVKNRVGVFRPMTNEQYESQKVNEEASEVINKNSGVAVIKETQEAFKALGFIGNMQEKSFGKWGDNTNDSLHAMQAALNLPKKDEVDQECAAAMFKALREKAQVAEANYAGYKVEVSADMGGISTIVKRYV